MRLPKINSLWNEKKTKDLFRFHLRVFIVGGIATNIFALFLPADTPFKTLIVLAPLIFNILAPFFFLTLKSKNVSFWFLVFILLSQTMASSFMAMTGGFQSVSSFGAYMILIFTLFELGVQATIILSIFTVLTLIGVVSFLYFYNPYPGYISQFFFYTIAYLLVVIQERAIGREISLQFEAKDKLKQLNTMKSQFIALTSHYLRTPITVIRGYLDTLELDIKSSNNNLEEIEDNLDKINDAVVNLQHLLEKLLFISNFVKETEELQAETINMDKFIEEMVNAYKLKAESKGVTLELREIKPLGVHIFDKKIITVACEELIDNAIKFSRNGKSVIINLNKNRDNLIIEIKDHGIGMSKDEISNLFQPFSRSTLKESGYLDMTYEGEGLGLFMAMLAIEAYKGEIQVESEKGKGTEFRIIIPQNKA